LERFKNFIFTPNKLRLTLSGFENLTGLEAATVVVKDHITGKIILPDSFVRIRQIGSFVSD